MPVYLFPMCLPNLKAVGAILTKNKGGGDERAMKKSVGWIEALTHPQIILKPDQEPAIKGVQEITRDERTKLGLQTILGNPAVNDHRQNGLDENAVKNARPQIRTMKCGLDRNHGKQLPEKSAILYWLIIYAGVLISRYRFGKDGKTAYQRIKRKGM